MENIAPSLESLIEIRHRIESGDSIKQSILSYVRSKEFDISQKNWANVLKQLCTLRDQGGGVHLLLEGVESSYQRALLVLLEKGLMGESILPQLSQLEMEMFESSLEELDRYLAILPIHALVPLLLFQFPAYLALLIGPLFFEVMRQL